jgi:hypothetical protein
MLANLMVGGGKSAVISCLVDVKKLRSTMQLAIKAPAGAPEASRPGEETPGAAERITVALIPAAAGGLQRLQERTNLSKTDIANRAITSYEFFDLYLQTGHELLVRDPATGETFTVRFL